MMTPRPSPISSTNPADAAVCGSAAEAACPLATAAKRLANDEEGQSSAEWIILSAFLIIGLAATFGVFPYIIAAYYRSMVEILCMPLP